MWAKIEFSAQFSQRAPVYERRAQACQHVLLGLWIPPEKLFGDEEPKQRIAEKFKPLVMYRVCAPMGQRAL